MQKKLIKYIVAAVIMMAVFSFSSVAAETSGEIDYVVVSATEQDADPGCVNPVRISAGYSRKYDLVSVEFDPAYVDWEPGRRVDVILTFKAKNGYYFTNSTNFRSYTMTLQKKSGDGEQMVVTYTYTPVMRLKSPTGVHYSEEFLVEWDKVNGARRYLVKVYEDGELKASVLTKDTTFDMSEYGTGGGEVTVTVSALASANDMNSVIKSFDVTPEYGMYLGESTCYGEFMEADGFRFFVDENRNKVYGWQFINGSWYYFNPIDGYAEGPGWFKDTDGHYYYFNSDNKMQVGWVTDGQYKYYLSKEQNGPFGAMVTGYYDADKTYGPSGGGKPFFNDGTYPDIPVGALVENK